MNNLIEFIEQVDIGMALIDSEDQISAINKHFQNLLISFTNTDLIFSGQELFDAIQIPHVSQHNQDVYTIRNNSSVYRITRKKIKLDEQTYCLIQAQDISAEDKQIKDLHTYASDMLVRVRSRITPIQNAITLYLDYKSAMSSQEIDTLFGMSKSELCQLERWIDALRDMSLLNSGHLEPLLKFTNQSALTLINDSCKEIQRTFSHTQLKPQFNISIPQEIQLCVDYNRVKRILVGILLNAVQHSPKESIIDVNAKIDQGMLSIFITDKGKGIQPEEQSRIFEYGYRSGKSENSSDAGLGTDLWLARALLLRMKARIQFESKIDVGTTFEIAFPIVNTVKE